jgi:hypothetical protein
MTGMPSSWMPASNFFLCDTLLRLAEPPQLFEPKWSEEIHYGLSGQCFGQEGFSGETPMKKRMEVQPKRVIPAFAAEAEEAEWWYKNRNIHGKQLLVAVKSGEAQVLTKEKLRERIAASKKTPAPV